MKKIVFITGTGHCGSTLLDLILSSHSSCFGLGELSALRSNADLYVKNGMPLCNIHGEQDQFWDEKTKDEILRYIRPRTGLRKALNKLLPQVDASIESNLRKKAYHFLFQKTQKRILIDSSKHPKWISISANGVEKSGVVHPYLLYLSRDGRAVINSYHRKYSDQSLENIAKDWIKKIQEINSLYEQFTGPKLWLRYEDLATDPDSAVRKVCDWLEISYEPSQLAFWEKEHHHIGGNVGTKSLLTKFQYNKLIATDAKKQAYYSNHAPSVQLDERWKQELLASQINAIEQIIEPYNKAIAFEK